MFVSNEVRLAGCSAIALMMMSIPALSHPSSPANVQPPVEHQVPTPQIAANSAAKKKISFLRRMTNVGNASWYGGVFDGHQTASGETFDMNRMTACHRTLPFGTMVKVVDLHSGKSVIVKINDRGLLFAGRIIDLSRGAADRLGIRQQGIASVRLEVLNKKQAALALQAEVAALKTDLPQTE